MAYILRNTLMSCAYAADDAGNVFVVPTDFNRMELYGMAESGQEFLHAVEEHQLLAKSNEEMQLERERFIRMYSYRSNTTNVQYTPEEYRYVIPPQGLHADNRGYLWMLTGRSLSPVFQVYDYTGELQYIVNIKGMDEEDTIDVLWWRFSSNGILAFSVDPYLNPKVYYYQYPF